MTNIDEQFNDDDNLKAAEFTEHQIDARRANSLHPAPEDLARVEPGQQLQKGKDEEPANAEKRQETKGEEAKEGEPDLTELGTDGS